MWHFMNSQSQHRLNYDTAAPLLFDVNPSRQNNKPVMRFFLMSFVFVLTLTSQIFAQQATKTVSGTIRDDAGQTLPGVSVSVKGTTTGTVADVSGHYTIKVSADATLVFSFIGYTAVEEKVGNRTNIDVTLKESQKNLDEVVVIGYGTVRRGDLTGAVSSVSGKDIAAVPVTNVAQAMQGKLPGVNITSQDGRPGGNINIRVRGGTSISQSNQALVLIDGVPGNLNDIPGDQVESVDVLKRCFFCSYIRVARCKWCSACYHKIRQGR